jgi:hypothetical protein
VREEICPLLQAPKLVLSELNSVRGSALGKHNLTARSQKDHFLPQVVGPEQDIVL